MPCLNDKFDPGRGPLINIGMVAGASVTCIFPGIAQTIGLQPIGMRPVISAIHSVPANAYLVDLLLPFGDTIFFILDTQVLEFSSARGSPFQILLGGDIICR